MRSSLKASFLLATLLFPVSASIFAAAPPAEKPAGNQVKQEQVKQEKEKKPTRAERKAEKKAREEAVAALPAKYRGWLAMVDLLISETEVDTFLALKEDYQRDAFIKKFWESRDTYRSTARNEFKDRWAANYEAALQEFGSIEDDRGRVMLLNGPPAARFTSQCSNVIWPTEVWYFATGDRIRGELIVVFYRKWGTGPYRIWSSQDGLDELFSNGAGTGSGEKNLGAIANGCLNGEKIATGIGWVLRQGMQYSLIQQRMMAKPEERTGEWVSAFHSYSTDMPEGAVPLPAKLEIDFPGRYQNRTVMQGLITVGAANAGQATLGQARTYNLQLNGEVLQNDELFDNFRYKFDFPPNPGETLPILFQRFLRPGEYMLIVKLEDINSGKVFREERKISVPATERVAHVAPTSDPESVSSRILQEANAVIANGETTLKIVRPVGEIQTGMERFDTLTTGENIAKVAFAMDGKPVLTKKRPPFSVELDLGAVPRPRTLTATAYDAAGVQIASDELLINASPNRFQVRLVEPQKGRRYDGSLLARAEATAPDGQAVERVEFFLNETRVATVYQPPYQQPILLPKDDSLSYVRAVAYLPDGNSTEHLVFVNAPENMAEVDVDFVELYTTVLDRENRPVAGLEAKDFTIFEEGVKQEMARFETVTDLPIHAAVALDVSASMNDSLDRARQAALQFLQGTLRPRDRAALITFNDHPNLAVKFTNDVPTLAGGLAGLKAERGTSLYDSIIFSLYYFSGIRGQRAILLLSDGKDEGSRFTYEDALDYARRAGVTIYSIGLGEDVDKKKLARLSEETGGRSFFVKSADELAAIYSAIEQELRSQYLIAYQSNNTSGGTGFRAVELKVGKPGLEAKTIRGYYP
jgi:Ca-activated chloride channel homolog